MLNKIGVHAFCSNKYGCSLSCLKTVNYEELFELSEDVQNCTIDFTELS